MIGRDLYLKVDDLLQFWAATAESDFLFGPEIHQYREDIFSRGHRLSAVKAQYDAFTQGAPPSGYDHNSVAEEISSQGNWFVEQITPVEGQVAVTEKFRPYLDISKM